MSIPVTYDGDAPTWDWILSKDNDGVVSSTITNTEWSIELEAGPFKPDEIDVQVVHGILIINLKHEARKDEFGAVDRNITRAYHLPSGVDHATVKSVLSPRGHLKISAQRKA